MITVLREIGLNMQYGVIQKADFKIVYVAPMKALAAEVTANFGKRLEALGGWGLGKCTNVWGFVWGCVCTTCVKERGADRLEWGRRSAQSEIGKRLEALGG